MKRSWIRMFAMLLAVVLAIPLSLLPVAAAGITVYGEQDFEGLTADTSLVTGNDFSAVPEYSTVKQENDNKFVRVPFIGGNSVGNWDKSIQVVHKALPRNGSVTIEVDYRPHYNNSVNNTLEAQFQHYGFTTADGTQMTGSFMNLYKINLSDGTLTNCGTVVDGAVGMKLDEWNHLKMVFDTSNGHFSIYVNGELYSVQDNPKMQWHNGSSWQFAENCTDITIDASKFIVAKCNKVAASYTGTDLGDATSYVDIDNIRIYDTPSYTVMLNGECVMVGEDGVLNLAGDGRQLIYAKVTKQGETPYVTTTPVIEVVDGMSIEAHTVGLTSYKMDARICTPLGLRFITALNIADYETLAADSGIKNIKIGTLVAPADVLETADAFTKSALADGSYLDIAATAGSWYGESVLNGVYYFAGSITDVREENYNRAFAGVGYMEITMADDTVYTVYAETEKEDVMTGTLAVNAIVKMRDDSLNGAQKQALKTFSDAFDGDVQELYGKDLTGLNVLAIGDSLFYGHKETVGDKQWINLLGNQFGWNLTNLGIGGATISYQEKQANGSIVNGSMYNLLFNTNTYKYGSSAHPSFYNCGSTANKKATDVDLILIQGGSNDYGTKVQAPQGTVDSTNPAEFLGAWRLMVDKLLEDYPNATIVMMTAWENYNQQRDDNANAIEYTSSVIDLYNARYANNDRVRLINSGSPAVSGVNMRDSAFKAQYAHDSYHLNDEGMKSMANAMLPLIWDVVADRKEQVASERTLMAEQLNDLNVLAIGDSLFDGDFLESNQTWLALLAKECKWNFTNLGRDGWTLAYNPGAYSEGQTVRTSMWNKLMNDSNYKYGSTSYYNFGTTSGKSNADVDLILLEGGTNDWGWNIPLGTVSDRTESTYYGALNLMIEKLLTQYPNATVVMVTGWHNPATNNRGEQRMDFVANGMKSVKNTNYATNDRVTVLDVGAKDVSGVDMTDATFKATYSKNGTDPYHLAANGMELVAQNLLPYIWKLVKG